MTECIHDTSDLGDKSSASAVVGDTAFEKINKLNSDINTTQGRNLIPYPYYDGMSKVQNGVTFIVNNEDGSVTANEISAGDARFYFVFTPTVTILL